MAKDMLLVLSGGMDSVTMLWDYRDRIALAVTFQYGSNHNKREARCARINCEKAGIEWLEIDLAFMGKYFKSSLLSGADAIPEADYADDNIRSTIVPFRNGIMLAVAAGLAESRGLKGVMLANHAGDHAIYPDCRPEFIRAMNAAISDGTLEHLQLFAPYTNMTKGEIALRGKELGVDYNLTYSCYKGGEQHCGQCATCREREEALKFAGIKL
ncbi:MAG: 7-cyano-7-deazaguanine synthase QueC [Muribaculaceae bacterium]|nr:7-cyano-7-deazaguanine synthase QueC [Muribaculaceae bacterium]